MHRAIKLALTFLVATLVTSLVQLPDADAGRREELKKQQRLNADAVKAMADGDYETAIEKLEASLEISELNVTWLNLGRAYAKAGRCQDALVAYDKMAVAPRVDEPPPEKLYEVLTRFRNELITDCPGTVVITCRPSGMRVSIDGDESQPCPDKPVKLGPGEHTFAGVDDGVIIAEQTVEVEGMTTTYVELVNKEALAADGPPTMVTESGGAGALDILGWTGVGLGVGMLVTALVVETTILADDIDAFDAAVDAGDFDRASAIKDSVDTTQTVNIGLYAAGGALTAVGLTMAIYALSTADSDAASGTRASVGMTRDGEPRVMFTTTF